MEGKIQTSFIPKRSVVETKPRNAPTTNIFSIIAWFIFIVVVAASVGVYVYEQYLNKSISAKNAELTNILNQFSANSSPITHFAQLDAQLKSANDILNNHVAFSALLGLIAGNALTSVQFTSLKYSYDNIGHKTSLSLSGKAPDFASVALQSDRFSSLTYFNNQSFSGISLDPKGSVLFSFSASINPLVLKYQPILSDVSTTTSTTTSN